jgi:hypothetical protein
MDRLHHLEEKPGARAVKIVNLVAYMPVSNGNSMMKMPEKSS